MAYYLNTVTLRADNSPSGLESINLLWQDITSGKIPLLFDSEHQLRQGISPISKYSGYADDEQGKYDLSILAVTADFFQHMDQQVAQGRYIKYEDTGDTLAACAEKAWARVWQDSQSGDISRAFTEDYESTVPAEYTKDGKAHCYLYIAVN